MLMADRAVFGRWLAGLFCLVLGGRLWLVGFAGSDLPLWDQWWAEFEPVIARLADASLSFPHLAELHNEHRLFFQRLSLLSLVALSGRWEPKDALVFSAFVRAVGLTIVFLLLARHQPRRVQAILVVLLAALGALPLGEFNVLSGFQVVFFMVEPMTVATLAVLFSGALTVERLALAFSLLLMSLVNLATVLITALAAVAVFGLRIALKRGPLSANLATLSALFVFSLFAYVTSVGMAHLQAESVSEFASVLAKLAAWPFSAFPLLGVIAVTPMFLLLRRLIIDAEAAESAWFVFALSLTFWIQTAAIAFARAKSGGTFPQYIDGLWLGHIVGFVALAEALRPRPGESPIFQGKACALWAFWLMSLLLSDVALRGIPHTEAVRRAVVLRQPDFALALANDGSPAFAAEVRHVHQMVLAGDFSFLDHPAGRFALPGGVYAKLVGDRERFEGLLPARLVGAPPAAGSVFLQSTIRLAPLLIVLGLIFLISGLYSKPAPAGMDTGKSDLDG